MTSQMVHSVTEGLLRKWKLFSNIEEEFLRRIRSLTVFHTPTLTKCPGGSGAIFITEDDEVYGIGHNCTFTNILGFEGSNFKVDDVLSPQKILRLSNRKIVSVSIGNLVGAAVASCGTLYWWGQCYGADGSVMAPHSPRTGARRRKYTRVSCGHRMMVALSAFGQVFMWGQVCCDASYSEGIQVNVGVGVKTISCGFHHLAMLDVNGYVYTWGGGDKGQRGFSSFTPKDRHVVTKIMYQTCQDIKCGPHSIYCLTRFHDIIACGSNGRPLSNNPDSALTRIRIREPVDDIDVAWVEGGVARVAITTVDGDIYQWGPNEHPSFPNAYSLIKAFTSWETTPGLIRVSFPKLRPTSPRSPKLEIPDASTLLTWAFQLERMNIHRPDSEFLASIASSSVSDEVVELLHEENGRNFILNKFLADLTHTNQKHPEEVSQPTDHSFEEDEFSYIASMGVNVRFFNV